MEFDKSTFHSTKLEFHIGKITFSLCEKQVFNLKKQDLTMHPNSPKCTRESPRVHCIKIVVSIHISTQAMIQWLAYFLIIRSLEKPYI